MGIALNPKTGDISWASGTAGSSGGIPNAPTDPSGADNYTFFYNTTSHVLKMYLFDTWIPFVNFKDIMLTDESGNILVDQSGNPILETNTIDFIRS